MSWAEVKNVHPIVTVCCIALCFVIGTLVFRALDLWYKVSIVLMAFFIKISALFFEYMRLRLTGSL